MGPFPAFLCSCFPYLGCGRSPRWDLVDDAVGAEEPKAAADSGAKASEFLGRGPASVGKEEAAQVAVAEAGRGEAPREMA